MAAIRCIHKPIQQPVCLPVMSRLRCRLLPPGSPRTTYQQGSSQNKQCRANPLKNHEGNPQDPCDMPAPIAGSGFNSFETHPDFQMGAPGQCNSVHPMHNADACLSPLARRQCAHAPHLNYCGPPLSNRLRACLGYSLQASQPNLVRHIE